jgi:hypothetical protein
MRPEEGIGEELRGEAEEVAAELNERVARARETVAAFVDEHPLAAVGIAFGTGYVVAGGLVSKMTGRLLKVGTRLALGLIVRQAMVSLPAMMLTPREGGARERAQAGEHEPPAQPQREH